MTIQTPVITDFGRNISFRPRHWRAPRSGA